MNYKRQVRKVVSSRMYSEKYVQFDSNKASKLTLWKEQSQLDKLKPWRVPKKQSHSTMG
jgi:hypothetical protein